MQQRGLPHIVVSHERPGLAVVALAGEHDAYSAPKLSRTLAEEVAEGRGVVVDLRHAQFLDSTNAGALLVADRRAATSGVRLVILITPATGPSVRQLFETARLATILTVVETVEDALELASAPLQSEE